MKPPRYALDWLPVPRRPWRILDTKTNDYVRDRDGKALTFSKPEQAGKVAQELEKYGTGEV